MGPKKNKELHEWEVEETPSMTVEEARAIFQDLDTGTVALTKFAATGVLAGDNLTCEELKQEVGRGHIHKLG